MFEDTFLTLNKRIHGLKMIGVWGKDGLELEKKCFTGMDEISRVIDLDFSGAELADIMGKLDRTKVSSGNYFVKLNYRRHILIIYSLTKDYFLMILADEGIIEGKLRFYLDIYRESIAKSL